jgi:hypothetical protein
MLLVLRIIAGELLAGFVVGPVLITLSRRHELAIRTSALRLKCLSCNAL